MIKIVARMIVKEECTEQFLELAKELVEKSKAEEGNVFYTLNRSKSDPKAFAFIECWKDKDAVKFHNATEHFTGILPKMADMKDGQDTIELFEEVLG